MEKTGNEPDMFEFFSNQIKGGVFDHTEKQGKYEISGMQRLIRATKAEIELGHLTEEQQKELGMQLTIRQSELGRTRPF